jgi:hypothetical protein
MQGLDPPTKARRLCKRGNDHGKQATAKSCQIRDHSYKGRKNVKSASSEKNPGKESESVQNKLVETMKANQVGYAPIVVTLAETRLGRDEVRKYSKLAAEQ